MWESIKEIFAGLENLADSKTVLGKPVVVGDITLVPVLALKLGLGTGGLEKTGLGGGGGGINVEPRAVIVVYPGGEVRVYSISRGDAAAEVAEMVPEVWEILGEESNGRAEK